MNFEHEYEEVHRSGVETELQIRSATGWALVSVIALPDCLGLFWRRAASGVSVEMAHLREVEAAAIEWSATKRCEMLNCDMTDLKLLLVLHPEKQWDAVAKRWVSRK